MTVGPAMRPVPAPPPSSDRRRRRSVFNRLSTYLPTMVILSMAIPMLIYLLFMKSMGWNLPLLGVQGAFSYASPTGSSVTLYASSNTKTYLASIGGNYEVLLAPWRTYFANRRLEFNEAHTASQLRKLKNGILVLPSAVSLSDEERGEIMAFRSKGGAILATWATGTRNGRGDWQGWQLLDNLGAKVVGEMPAASNAHNLVLTGESPVSHTQFAGQRIELSKTSEALLRARGEAVGARLMNWSRVTDEERRDEGAVIFSEATRQFGRFAFFAFAESRWEAHTLGTYSLIDDTLQWLRRDPAIVRASWPYGKRAAEIIEMDTEEGFRNALRFATMMQSINYRSTFYVLSSAARQFPDIVTRLARDFELGYHGDVLTSFKGQSGTSQEQRMQAMRNEMASLIPDVKMLTGFRAPAEGYDATTEQLLPKFGINHHMVDPNRSDGRLPLLISGKLESDADALVVLPRTQRDDDNLNAEKLSVSQTTKALIDDFDLALDTGALGLLSVHSRNFGPDSVMAGAMPGFLEHLKQRRDQLWMASAGQVADWWRDRDRFKLSASSSGNAVEFNITVTGTQPVKGAALIVMLPQKGIHAVIEGMKIGMPKATVLKIDDYRAGVVFDSLVPGSYAYRATFSPN